MVEAFELKVWRAFQTFAFERLREAITAPVVGEMVRVLSEFVTEETPVVRQVPLTAKQPPARFTPLVAWNEVVAVVKFAMPWIERSVPGEEVPIPTFPTGLTTNWVPVDEPMAKPVVPATGLTARTAKGEVVPIPRRKLLLSKNKEEVPPGDCLREFPSEKRRPPL